MLTALHAWKRLRELRIDIPLAEVKTSLARVDREDLLDRARSRHTFALWDKETPVNGIPPEQIAHPSGGEVYLVYVDGFLRQIQNTDPRQAGFVPIDKLTAETLAKEACEQCARRDADEKCFEALLEILA